MAVPEGVLEVIKFNIIFYKWEHKVTRGEAWHWVLVTHRLWDSERHVDYHCFPPHLLCGPAILSTSTNTLFTHLTFLACNSKFSAHSLLNKGLVLGEQQCIKLCSNHYMHSMVNTTPTTAINRCDFKYSERVQVMHIHQNFIISWTFQNVLLYL